MLWNASGQNRGKISVERAFFSLLPCRLTFHPAGRRICVVTRSQAQKSGLTVSRRLSSKKSLIYLYFLFSLTLETIHRKMIIRMIIVNWLDYCQHSVQEHSQVLKGKYYFHLVMRLRKDSAPNSLYINDLKISGLGSIVFSSLSNWATELFASRKCYLRIWVSL